MVAPELVPFQSHELAELVKSVERYFAHDGLKFGPHVVSALSELLESPELGIAWKICAGGAVVGHCVVTYAFDQESGGRIGMLTELFLNPEARGRGCGTRVLADIRAWCRGQGLRQLWLFVLNQNEGARRLYAREGFKPELDREFLSKTLDEQGPSYG